MTHNYHTFYLISYEKFKCVDERFFVQLSFYVSCLQIAVLLVTNSEYYTIFLFMFSYSFR